MTEERLTTLLAQNVMGWGTASGRFLMRNRQWLPNHRFQPTKRIEDAFRVLEKAAPKRYTMHGDDTGVFCVAVQIGRVTGEARDRSKPLALTLAIARALLIEVGDNDCDRSAV